MKKSKDNVETFHWFYNKGGKLKVKKIKIYKTDYTCQNIPLTIDWLRSLKEQFCALSVGQHITKE